MQAIWKRIEAQLHLLAPKVREHPGEYFSVHVDLGPDGLGREYSDEREEPIGLDALFESFPDEFPDDSFPGIVWLM